MGKKSLQKIANELGTTKVTVWRVANNQKGVGPELKSRILEKLAENNKLANEKKAAVIKADKLACVLAHRFFFKNESFYTSIYQKLNELCVSNNIELTLFVLDQQPEIDGLLPLNLTSNSFDGVFLIGELDLNFLKSMSALKIPFIVIDFLTPRIETDFIVADNFYLGYLATCKLIENNHKNIGFIGAYNKIHNIMDRYLGFKKALDINNLILNPDWIFNINDPVTGLYTSNFQLPENLPTAFLCHCDMAAYYLIEKLKTIGVRVPEDISIVSFDNTDLATKIEPPLSSINIDTSEFATLSYKLLNDRIKNPDLEYMVKYVNGRLIQRDSVIFNKN